MDGSVVFASVTLCYSIFLIDSCHVTTTWAADTIQLAMCSLLYCMVDALCFVCLFVLIIFIKYIFETL